MELRKTALVADYLNEKGNRIPSTRGMRKYLGTDVTEILDYLENKNFVDSEVYAIVKKMQVSKRLVKGFLLSP